MSASNYFENALLSRIVAGVALPPMTTVYFSLHTSDPGEAGTQVTNEATYASYARVGVLAAPANWVIAGGIAENNVEIIFPSSTGGTNTLTHFAVGLDPTGTGQIIASGPLDLPLNVSAGITPIFQIGELSIQVE